VVDLLGERAGLGELPERRARAPGERPGLITVAARPQRAGAPSLVRNRQEASGREFDRHVRELVDFNIREVAKRLRAQGR